MGNQMPAGPYLVMQGGVLDGEVFPLKEGAAIIIGSGRLADIQVANSDVSSAHLKVTWDDTGLFVIDNASFTGTYVNDEQVETATLWDGDTIGFAAKKDKPAIPTLLVRVPEGSVMVTAPPPEPEAPPAPAPEKAKAALPPPSRRVPREQSGSARSSARQRRGGGGLPVEPRVLALGGGALLGLALLVFLVVFLLGRRGPALTGVTPALVEAGQSATITGRRFGKNAGDNTVRFGEAQAKTLTATNETLTVTVPEIVGVKAGETVPVTVEARGKRSEALHVGVRLTPRVASLLPDVALPGETVVARGQAFDAPGLTVTVDGRPAVLLQATPNEARFRVPDLPVDPNRQVSVEVAAEGRVGKPAALLIGRVPLLVGVEPGRVDVGERVTLSGRGFSPVAAENRVLVGGARALVVEARADALDVVVPEVGQRSEVLVSVEVGGRTTGALALTVIGPSTRWFRLRFFAGGVEGAPNQATISTALGPIVLLQASDSLAVAKRAHAGAMALNVLSDEMRSGKVTTLEARAVPSPAVGPPGAAALLQVLPDDAAAYEAPPGLAPSVRPTEAALAEHWAALLNDYFGAFVLGRRPSRLFAVSPRAGALGQSLTEMGWRSGEGVEPSRAYALGAENVRKLRELALIPGRPGQAVPALAVEGRWEGSATEAGTARNARLQLRVAGGRLAGSLTLGGGITMEVPIRDAVVEGGVLVFSYRQARTKPVWVAQLDAEVLKGQIHEASPAGEVLGTFELRYAP